ncbi:hypothetical protein M8J77_005413 [Diaphorina citri]|nr:hypothetical protein M8J77_005413 [Diaphorina citri]
MMLVEFHETRFHQCAQLCVRIFGMKRCFRCQATISSTELVMRAQEYVFHVACFSCITCSNILKKGDHFGMRDGLVYCRSHYQELPMISPDYDEHYTSPSPDFSHHHHHSHHHNHHHHHSSIHSSETPSPSNPDSVKVNSFFNGAPTPRQKGRPRKRKPKDIEGLTANLDLNSDSYLDVFPGTPGLGGGNHQRTKRMRTSFKHHQLRTMKSYFAINHNPDAKDLKQLSQKTGLPKRVLQVWFQNARAKWRRMVMKQDGGSSKSGDKSCGENSNSGLDLDSYQLDSPEDSHYLSSPLECSS